MAKRATKATPGPDDAGGMTAAVKATIAKIARWVEEGHCILFLGAGVHCPPPTGCLQKYADHERPLLGRELTQHLAADPTLQAKFPGETATSLQRIAMLYEIAN